MHGKHSRSGRLTEASIFTPMPEHSASFWRWILGRLAVSSLAWAVKGPIELTLPTLFVKRQVPPAQIPAMCKDRCTSNPKLLRQQLPMLLVYNHILYTTISYTDTTRHSPVTSWLHWRTPFRIRNFEADVRPPHLLRNPRAIGVQLDCWGPRTVGVR